MSRPTDWAPLAGSDPVSGDPAAVKKLADRYRDTATAIDNAVKGLRAIHDDSSGAWVSPAGTAFRERTGEMADSIARAFGRYDRAATALASYSGKLDSVQERADDLLAKAKVAQDAADDAERDSGTESDKDEPDEDRVKRLDEAKEEAEGKVGRYRDDLDDLEGEWNRIGNDTRDELDEINNTDDGLKDSGWQDFLGGLEEFTKWCGRISAVLGVIAAICAVIPGLQPFAALFGTLALITGLLSLAGNTVLYFNGRATLSDVLWDVASVASFGIGRAFIASGRAVMTGARGLARPATISALRSRALPSTARNINKHAGTIATRMGATGGGRAAKALAGRAASPTGWLPRGADLKSMYSPKGIYNDVANGISRTPVSNPVMNLPDAIRNLPQVQSGIRHAAAATGAANLAGVGGNVADGKTLTDWMKLPESVPIIGSDRTPVER